MAFIFSELIEKRLPLRLDRRRRWTIIAWQASVRVLMAPAMRLMNRGTDIQFDAGDLERGVRYIVASNHQSGLDSFVMLGAFSRRQYQHLKPFRAMTLNVFFDMPLVKWGALFMGCFPAKSHAKYSSGIEFAAELMQNGHQTVFICPEGGRTLPGTKPARSGVAVLAGMPNVKVIPAHIQWYRTGVLGRSYRLTMGRPMDAAALTPQAILDLIYALPLPAKP